MSYTGSITIRHGTYTAHFEEELEAGGYVVTCPGLLAVVTEGDTLEEARERVREAIVCLFNLRRS